MKGHLLRELADHFMQRANVGAIDDYTNGYADGLEHAAATLSEFADLLDSSDEETQRIIRRLMR